MRFTKLALVASLWLLSSCSSISFLAANTPASFGNYSRLANLAYADQPRNKLDVFVPLEKRIDSPIIIFVHGGGWYDGDKDEYKFVGAAFAEQGYVAVLPNYGLYPHVKSPTFLQDIAESIAWVRTHATEWGGDANRIYLVGHSAGAQIAMMVALDNQYLRQVGGDSHWISGVIGLAGPYDFIPFTFPYMNDLFGPPERFAESQPVNYVRADAPPLLLIHGLQDHTVAPTNTRSLYDAMTQVHGNVQVEYFDNATHSDLVAAFSFLRNRKPPVMQDIRRFIDQHSTHAAVVSPVTHHSQ